MTNGKYIGELAQRFLRKRGSVLAPDEARVLKSIIERQAISRDPLGVEGEMSFWDALADRVAAVGGSWAFIFTFLAVLGFWMLLNTEVLAIWKMAFDPYPYIFLNLMLSMIAALQAPVIMMSQNRQAERDRIAARHDYEVNLRAELEIMALHEKWDALRLADLKSKIDRHEALLERVLARLDGRSSAT